VGLAEAPAVVAMSELTDTFLHVQEMKDTPWEPPAELVDALAQRWRAQMGEEITSAQLLATVQGVGWILHMCQEHDIPFDELMTVTAMLEQHVTVNRRRTQMAGGPTEHPLTVGLGAGFFTGLWLGLELAS
jgi:hypothetical protein